MPVTTREMYLVLRARDEASRVVRNFAGSIESLDKQTAEMAQKQIRRGQAMMTVGIGVAGAGVIGARALNDMTNAAADYNSAAAQTLTQTDNLKTSVQELSDIGKRVARDIPVPIMELQETLKFIFSSMNVNVREAEELLRGFAKEAVTGQSSIQAAARTSIALLNAYSLPVSELTRLQDVQFQVVRKGVITYDELSNNIGKAIPAAVRAGQEFETLGAMMSFMTRNGLNAAMSATSAARALELFAHPTTVERLESLGIQVRNTAGEFLPLVDVIAQMADRFQGMPAPEKAAALQELFAGSGNRIQARRFWDMVLTNFDDFRQHVRWMGNSQGVFKEAYKTMFEAPVSQIQLLKNQYEAMRIEVGERLLPVKLKLVRAVTKLLDAWNGLSPATQDMIIKIAALAAGISIIVGIVSVAAGFFLVLKGAAVIAGVGLSAVVGITALVAVGIAALIAGIILLVIHWDTVKKAALDAWNTIRDVTVAVWEKIVEWFNIGIEAAKEVGKWFSEAATVITDAWNVVWGAIGPTIMRIVEWVMKAVDAVTEWATGLAEDLFPRIKGAWDSLVKTFNQAVQKIISIVGPIIEDIQKVISRVMARLLPHITKAWDAISKAIMEAWEVIQPVFDGFGKTMGKLVDIIALFVKVGWKYFLKPFLEELAGAFVATWQIVAKVVEVAIHIIVAMFDTLVNVGWYGILKPILAILGAAFGAVFDIIATIVVEAIGIIARVFKNIVVIFKGVIDFIYALIHGDWSGMWEAAKDIVGGIIGLIVELFVGLPVAIFNVLKSFVQGVIDFFKDLWFTLVGGSIIPDIINDIVDWFFKLPQMVIDALMGFLDRILRFFRDLLDDILSIFSGNEDWLTDAGKTLVRGFLNGLKWYWEHTILHWLWQRREVILGFFDTAVDWLFEAGKDILTGLWNGIKWLWNHSIAKWFWDRRGAVLKFFKGARDWLWRTGRNILTGLWNGIKWLWNHSLAKWFWDRKGVVLNFFRDARDWLWNAGRNIIRGAWDGLKNIWRAVAGWFNSRKENTKRRFRDARDWLYSTGKNIIRGLKDGLENALRNINSWIKRNIVTPIVAAVKHYFGIGSPSKVFATIGGNLAQGLVRGLGSIDIRQLIGKIFGSMPNALAAIVGKGIVALSELPGRAWKALQGVGGWAAEKLSDAWNFLFDRGGGAEVGKIAGRASGGNLSSSVTRWAPLVMSVLSMLGAPMMALGPVLQRMQRESGGNPWAINLWDINAMRGYPSRGLMQTIPQTFNAYAGPFQGRGIYDPLANIYAGVNYAMHRYGAGWLGVMLRPGGYAEGGMARAGEIATLGERGWELVASGMARFSRPAKVYDADETAKLLGAAGKTEITQHITVNTQEIDPLKHAADLGWELATRVA